MEFQRKLDRNKIPVCSIMGVDIAAINMDWLLNYTVKNIRSLSGDYICVSNVHTTVMAYENKNYRAVQNGGIMAIPDGGPLSAVGRKRGYKNMRRTTGPSYMEEIFKISSERGYRHFFYGSTETTLNQLCRRLHEKYPGIQIVGRYSPPFKPLTDLEDAAVVYKINSTRPDFVWIGLGAPKQEEWMATHQGKVSGLMVGVGAGFDYHAGNLKRAPLWMQEHSLEWLYRLKQEPWRLAKRYMIANTLFLWLLLKEKICIYERDQKRTHTSSS